MLHVGPAAQECLHGHGLSILVSKCQLHPKAAASGFQQLLIYAWGVGWGSIQIKRKSKATTLMNDRDFFQLF